MNGTGRPSENRLSGFQTASFIRRPKKRDKAAVSAVWGIKYLFCLIKSI